MLALILTGALVLLVAGYLLRAALLRRIHKYFDRNLPPLPPGCGN